MTGWGRGGSCDDAAMRALALRVVPVAAVCLLLAALAIVGKAWWDSRLPGTYSVMDYGTHDYGGGSVPASHDAHGGGTSVADLHGPRSESPDARYTLHAREATIRLASGREIDALTFDGRSPGPELRVRKGDLVEVTLVNEDVEAGVTVHWHGVDVPNAEDGVAGVTQDAVLPGERHVYRFRAEQVGTFWYHTHQVSSKEVRRGLFGVLVIEPKGGSTFDLDEAVVAHTFEGVPDAERERRNRPTRDPAGDDGAVPPGELRLDAAQLRGVERVVPGLRDRRDRPRRALAAP